MNQDEIDKIIADAVAESQQKSKKNWHRGQSRNRNLNIVRQCLNWLFMLGFVAAVIIYFVLPEQRVLFFSIGFSAVAIKLIEFYIRFML